MDATTTSGRLQEEIHAALFQLLVNKNTRKEYLEALVDLLRKWCGCDCAGIRVATGEGKIPYESYRGFSEEFWEKENYVVLGNERCACLRAMQGDIEPEDFPLRTEGGSLCAEDMEKHIAALPEESRSKYLAICVKSGLKSIATIPIRFQEKLIAAIHLADKRSGAISCDFVRLLESFAPIIGESILRFDLEDTVRRHEEQYRTLVENLSVGVYRSTLGPEGRFLFANDALARILGIDSRDKLSQMKVSDFYEPPEDRERVMEELSRSGVLKEKEVSLRRPDGTHVWVAITSSAHRDAAGAIDWVDGIVEDITERIQTRELMLRTHVEVTRLVVERTAEIEEARSESERIGRQYELVLNSAAEGIFGLDKNGNHTFVNPAAARMLGYSIEELIGRHSHSTWHYKHRDGTPYPKEECLIYKTLSTGEPCNRRDEVFWRKDGKKFPVEYTASPIVVGGEIVGSVVTFFDITEQRRSEEEHRAIIYSALDGFWMIDGRGRILEVNDSYCRMTGYSRDELMRMEIKDIEAVETAEEIEERINRIVKDGSGRFEASHRCKDGRILDVEVSATYLDIDGGRFIAFIRDSTQRKRMEAERLVAAKESERQAMKTDFMSMMSHELRTPLTLIKGYASLFDSELRPGLSDQQQEAITKIKIHAKNLDALVSSILDFTHLAFGGSMTFEKEPLEIVRTIRDVIEGVHAECLKKDIRCEVILADQLPVVFADEAMLKRAFFNIFSNAIKFSAKGGAIRLQTEVKGDRIIIRVTDHGVGIAGDQVECIFERFYQVESVMTRAHGGIGMGLAIAREIVEGHGGRIWAESAGLGKGTTFTIELPIGG